ncbi:hypothetical protein G9A89_005757 [Geosiphon pyriformis]|nr:hypothetical protein G9A89_005757 [Geosiphon pyriformis]
MSNSACCDDDEEYPTATKFYCCPCIIKRKWDNQPCLACGETLLDERMWNNIPERKEMCDKLCQYTILINDWVRKGTPIEAVWRRTVKCLDSCLHDNDKIWRMALTKIEGASSEEIRKFKNNSLEPIKLNWDSEPVINILELEEFHEHYQHLAPTREEQEQWLEQLNARLCYYCLIFSDFKYCNECNLIYNLPLHMIYTIPEEEEPISSCILKLELVFNSNSNSNNNDDKNTSSSSAQNNNKNISDSDSDSNPKMYIALFDLSKEQELKWYSDNDKNIMPECTHDTDAKFDLRYLEKEVIKLEPNSHTCIDFKIALEILATIMVQLAFKSSLAKKGINIRGGIINTGYVRNIIVILQNDSEKAYIIEPNKKITQAIFLPLIKIAQLMSVRNREELGITAKEIQRFGLMSRIDISVNMVEEEVIDKGEIISTCQSIFIPPYDQLSCLKQKPPFANQERLDSLIFTYQPKAPKTSKFHIYNTTGNIIEIPKGTIIGYLITEVEDQPPNHISDFLQLCGYVDITSQTIYGHSKCYLLQPEQLEQTNMGNLDPLQRIQLKMLLNNFNDIFASKNEFG